ncbi:MAG: hypothetical protein WKF92_07760 [Pyrinomonadaceae bacterium]
MATTVSQMTVNELRTLIGDVIEEKLSTFLLTRIILNLRMN